jgi:hypothetical protein
LYVTTMVGLSSRRCEQNLRSVAASSTSLKTEKGPWNSARRTRRGWMGR